MMKLASYTAFTLAEVLLSLVIIGVIAAMTTPILMSNLSDRENKTSWKKVYSDMSQVTETLKRDNGGNLAGLFSSGEDMRDKFVGHLKYAKVCTGSQVPGNCWHKSNGWGYLNGTKLTGWQDPSVMLNNGTMYIFYLNETACSSGSYGDTCGLFHVDVNAFKKPNVIGKDIFAAKVVNGGLRPYGLKDSNAPATTCIENSTAGDNTGYGCSYKYLYEDMLSSY